MLEITQSAYVAFYLYLIMVLAQWLVATIVKARQPNAIPGKISSDLSHESFVFRAHRTYQNTLENSPLFIASLVLALSLNIHGIWFDLSVWVYVIARIIHMVLYYSIATEKNPSPRSYFFLLGLVANMLILVLIGLRLF